MLNTLRIPLQVLAAIFVCVVQAQGAESKSKLENDPQGWMDILPPADLKGWYRVPVPPIGQLGREQWHVDAEKKVLICDISPRATPAAIQHMWMPRRRF